MAQITIDVPDDFAQRLQPQVLELGLQEFQSQQRQSNFLDEQDLISLLASQPTPEQILDIFWTFVRPQSCGHKSANYQHKVKAEHFPSKKQPS